MSGFGDISDPADHDAVRDILQQAFSFIDVGDDPHARWVEFRDLVGREQFRRLRVNGEVVAGLCVYRMGQWWGGRAVPMGGVAAVGVSPEHRGTGAGAELMRQQLLELHREGIGLSTLYASTQRLYRKVGYEQAGSCVQWKLPLQSLRPGDRSLPATRVQPDDPLMRGLYRLRALTAPGNLERNDAIWRRVRREFSTPVWAYLLGDREDPQGYVVFAHNKVGGAYDLMVRDVVALTPAAVGRLWTLLADHRSMAPWVHWAGPAHEPLITPLPEQRAEVEESERWLLRVVDVPGALQSRGFPADVEAELHLEVVGDDVIPDNNGNWVVKVSGGRAEVDRGGRGDVRTTINGLAPLYAALFRATDLARLGLVEGTDVALAGAEQVFAGGEPWMSDRF